MERSGQRMNAATEGSIQLIPLRCVQCSAPVPAEPDEAAWVCSLCGQGLQLDEEHGLRPLEVRFAQSEPRENLRWHPFWVAEGKVEFQLRETYGRDSGPDPLWGTTQVFLIPAFECTLEQAGNWGAHFLRHPHRLPAGSPSRLPKVTVEPNDAQALADFVVLTIEAERKDQLKRVEFSLDLAPWSLWILPYAEVEGVLRLASAG